ncbi:MAG: hypothetical protein AB7N76_35465 [Planctomycetota bacterium]
MSDERLRALERRYRETGAEEDEAAWLAARLRAAELEPARALLLAALGHPAALAAIEDAAEVFQSDYLRYLRAGLRAQEPELLQAHLSACGREAGERAALALGRAAAAAHAGSELQEAQTLHASWQEEGGEPSPPLAARVRALSDALGERQRELWRRRRVEVQVTAAAVDLALALLRAVGRRPQGVPVTIELSCRLEDGALIRCTVRRNTPESEAATGAVGLLHSFVDLLLALEPGLPRPEAYARGRAALLLGLAPWLVG